MAGRRWSGREGDMRLRWRLPIAVDITPRGAAGPTPEEPVALPPAGLDFVYASAVGALAAQQQALGSLDARAGVLIGATAAAFGLIASAGGGTSSLFSEHPALASAALLVLALAFVLLLLAVRAGRSVEFPGVPTLIDLAALPEWRIRELSLDALQTAWLTNRTEINRKARLLLEGQVALGVFIGLVVVFKLSDLWPTLASALGHSPRLPR